MSSAPCGALLLQWRYICSLCCVQQCFFVKMSISRAPARAGRFTGTAFCALRTWCAPSSPCALSSGNWCACIVTCGCVCTPVGASGAISTLAVALGSRLWCALCTSLPCAVGADSSFEMLLSGWPPTLASGVVFGVAAVLCFAFLAPPCGVCKSLSELCKSSSQCSFAFAAIIDSHQWGNTCMSHREFLLAVGPLPSGQYTLSLVWGNSSLAACCGTGWPMSMVL